MSTIKLTMETKVNGTIFRLEHVIENPSQLEEGCLGLHISETIKSFLQGTQSAQTQVEIIDLLSKDIE